MRSAALTFVGLLGLVCFVSAPVAMPLRADQPSATEVPLAVSLHRGEGNEIIIRFRNRSKSETLHILKPIDGSVQCWIMPHYSFSISDGRGTKFLGRPRCGNFGGPWGETAWPDDYLVKLRPGESYDEAAYLPFEFNKAGEYEIGFEYVFTPTTKFLRDGKTPYPKELWRGKAKAKPVRMKLEAQPLVVG